MNEFSYELILTEISDEQIKAVYREYSEDMIRSQFSYKVVFNIKNDKVIHFQSKTIEIKNCSNNQIEYTVLSD